MVLSWIGGGVCVPNGQGGREPLQPLGGAGALSGGSDLPDVSDPGPLTPFDSWSFGEHESHDEEPPSGTAAPKRGKVDLDHPPRVEVRCGTTYEGRWQNVRSGLEPNRSATVAAFRGIRYGQAPLGHLRWKPPMKPECDDSKVYLATSDGPQCVQAPSPLAGAIPRKQSEDCLLLNVFTPAMGAPEPLPVLVWIHGGDLEWGSNTMFGAIETFALDDVVVVAVNYRLGALGWMALEELSSADPRGVSGNYGVLDVLLALEWVRDNIMVFGGDRNRVTVMGQSSGGTLVLALLASYRSQGLFHRAISLSGSPNITMSLDTAEKVNAYLFLNATGCAEGKTSVTGVVDCLYRLPAERLSTLPSAYSATSAYSTLPSRNAGHQTAGLAIFDGVTVSHPLLEALSYGLVDVPLIVQSMAAEGQGPNATVQAWHRKQFELAIRTAMHEFDPSDALGEKLVQYYGAVASVSAESAFYAAVADISMTCGTQAVALAAAKAFRSPVYLGYCSGHPTHPIGMRHRAKVHDAVHGWDFIAGTGLWDLASFFGGGPYNAAPDDLRFGQMLRDQWLQLIRTGSLEGLHEHETIARWEPVNAVRGNVTTGLVQQTQTIDKEDLKTDLCALLSTHGLDQRFWLVN